MLGRAEVVSLAERILESEPSASVQVRLYRDALEDEASSQYKSARRQLSRAAAVARLESEQRLDGSWGRFHSRDSRLKRQFPTTEHAVRRGIALGLTAESRSLSGASKHCRALLRGEQRFPDPPEANDRWETGWRLFVSSTLARIDPSAAALRPGVQLWSEILTESFRGESFDPQREIDAHRDRTGATIEGTYLRLSSRYPVELLTAAANAIPPARLRAYLRWLTACPSGIGYLGVPLDRPPKPRSPGSIDAWLESWELISRYPGWGRCGASMARWLGSQRNENGLWDFGPRPAHCHTLPLSEDWRRASSREVDWSTRVLCLLASYLEFR